MNITQMINRLICGGLSQQEIATKVKTTQTTIHRISKGSSTSYELGKRIESLYLQNANDEPYLQSENNAA
jgi:transcriptional regulator